MTEQSEFEVVYRGYDPLQADLLARAIEADGIVCRHLGTQHPAQIGLGELGAEQIIEVPQADRARARELIVALSGTPDEPAAGP